MLNTLIKPYATGHECAVCSRAVTQKGLQQVREVKEPFSFSHTPSVPSPSAKQGHHLLEDPELSAESHTAGTHFVAAVNTLQVQVLFFICTPVCATKSGATALSPCLSTYLTISIPLSIPLYNFNRSDVISSG